MYSCVFGFADLPELYRRPELVAHKLYMNFEPATFFCLYRAIPEPLGTRRRACELLLLAMMTPRDSAPPPPPPRVVDQDAGGDGGGGHDSYILYI